MGLLSNACLLCVGVSKSQSTCTVRKRVSVSVSGVVATSDKSLQNSFFFIVKKQLHKIKVSQKYILYNKQKQNHWCQSLKRFWPKKAHISVGPPEIIYFYYKKVIFVGSKFPHKRCIYFQKKLLCCQWSLSAPCISFLTSASIKFNSINLFRKLNTFTQR